MKETRVIGLSGLAGCGKDLFYSLLSKRINCQRFALADLLKEEINPSLIKLYGIDIFNCTREQKDLVRPMLIAHGKVRRVMSSGTHWTNFLKTKIDEFLLANPDSVAVVTDIRYEEYEKDEVHWIKKVMGGKLVHISKYIEEADGGILFQSPPNPDEERNNPRVRHAADFRVEWLDESMRLKELDSDRDKRLGVYVEKFLTDLKRCSVDQQS